MKNVAEMQFDIQLKEGTNEEKAAAARLRLETRLSKTKPRSRTASPAATPSPLSPSKIAKGPPPPVLPSPTAAAAATPSAPPQEVMTTKRESLSKVEDLSGDSSDEGDRCPNPNVTMTPGAGAADPVKHTTARPQRGQSADTGLVSSHRGSPRSPNTHRLHSRNVSCGATDLVRVSCANANASDAFSTALTVYRNPSAAEGVGRVVLKPPVPQRFQSQDEYAQMHDRDFQSIHEERTHLRGNVVDLEKVIGLLKAEVVRLKSELLLKGRDCTFFKEQAAQLRAAKDREVATLAAAREDWGQTVADRDVSVAKLQSDLSMARRLILDLQEGTATSKSALERHRRESTEEKAIASDRLKQLQEKLQKVEAEGSSRRAETESVIGGHIDQIANLKSRLSQVQQEHRAMANKVVDWDSMISELTELRSQIAEFRRGRNSNEARLRAELGEAAEEIYLLREEKARLLALVERLELQTNVAMHRLECIPGTRASLSFVGEAAHRSDSSPVSSVQELNEEVASITASRTRITKEIQNFRDAEKSSALGSIGKLRQHLSEEEVKRHDAEERLQHERAARKEYVRSVGAKLAAAEKEVKDLRTMTEERDGEIARLNQRLAESVSRFEQLKHDADADRERNVELEERAAQHQSQLEEERRRTAAVTTENANLFEQLQAQGAVVADLQDEVGQRRVEADAAEARAADLERTIAQSGGAARGAATTDASGRCSPNGDRQRLNDEVSRLKEALAEASARAADVERELLDERDLRGELSQQLETFQSGTEQQAQEAASEAQQKHATLQEENERAAAALLALTGELVAAKEELASEATARKEARAAIDALEAKQAAVTVKVKALAEELSDAVASRRVVERELTAARASLKAANAEKEDMQRTAVEITARSQALQEQLQASEEAANEREEAIHLHHNTLRTALLSTAAAGYLSMQDRWAASCAELCDSAHTTYQAHSLEAAQHRSKQAEMITAHEATIETLQVHLSTALAHKATAMDALDVAAAAQVGAEVAAAEHAHNARACSELLTEATALVDAFSIQLQEAHVTKQELEGRLAELGADVDREKAAKDRMKAEFDSAQAEMELRLEKQISVAAVLEAAKGQLESELARLKRDRTEERKASVEQHAFDKKAMQAQIRHAEGEKQEVQRVLQETTVRLKKEVEARKIEAAKHAAELEGMRTVTAAEVEVARERCQRTIQEMRRHSPEEVADLQKRLAMAEKELLAIKAVQLHW